MEESEKEKVFLQRQWELLEGNKKLRSQIPSVCCALIIGICAFFLNKKEEVSSLWYVFTITALLLGGLGLLALRKVHLQYDYTSSKIDHLYDKFKINYLDDHDYPNKELYEKGQLLFKVGYIAIVIFLTAAIVLFIWTRNG